MQCNLCGSTEFRDVNGRAKALCGSCGSYERTRLVKLYVDQLDLPPTARVLHLAPEWGLYRALRARFADYVAADYDLHRYRHIEDIRRIDLTDFESYASLGRFDLVIHNHVIEHLPCNYTAVLIRLHKLLTPRGHHLFSVPIYGSSFEETLATISSDEAARRFGQFDHVRRFSAVDLQATLGAIFEFPREYRALDRFDADALRDANVPELAWTGYSGHSVFDLQPAALRL